MDYAFWQKHNTQMTRTKYESEDAAKAVLKEFLKRLAISSELQQKNEISNYVFCPIIGAQCRLDCICYKEHMVIKRTEKVLDDKGTQVYCQETKAWKFSTHWVVYDWECRNVQVSGVVYVERP